MGGEGCKGNLRYQRSYVGFAEDRLDRQTIEGVGQEAVDDGGRDFVRSVQGVGPAGEKDDERLAGGFKFRL